VDLDRQSIERRDFPISRRGYDPAAVDAHLRQLTTAVHDLQQALDERHGESLGSAAAGQVQSILEAAETTAADIEHQAAQQAAATREAADRDARRTRDDAVARAQAHVQAVSQATTLLLEKVESMDQEVGALVQSLRAGASRLASDLRAVEVNMGELYDTAAAGGTREAAGGMARAHAGNVLPAGNALAAGNAPELETEPQLDPQVPPGTETAQDTAFSAPTPPAASGASNGSSEHAPTRSLPAIAPAPAPSGGGEDLDGARLIALNMALNGEPREQADRYLAENFQLADRQKLLDEVYAAIEG
jgi:DivIVA domain-containing protein